MDKCFFQQFTCDAKGDVTRRLFTGAVEVKPQQPQPELITYPSGICYK